MSAEPVNKRHTGVKLIVCNTHPEMTKIWKFCGHSQETTLENMQKENEIDIYEGVSLVNFMDMVHSDCGSYSR